MPTLDTIVRRNAMRFPDKVAVKMGGRSLSWSSLDTRVNQLSRALQDEGLEQGDRVAIIAGNCLEYWEIYFACARSGLIAVPVNYRLTPREAEAILTGAEPGLLIFSPEFSALAGAVKDLPGLDHCWSLGKDPGGPATRIYEEALTASSSDPLIPQTDETDTFAIFFTSGTTGLPKGAMVTHLNLEANGFNQIIADRASGDDVNLTAAPLYHMGAVFMGITYMMLGCTQLLLPVFDPNDWLRALATQEASVSLLVPTMINAVLNAREFDEHDKSSLRLIFYGGGPMPPAVLRRAIEKLDCSFTQGYGLTETLEATFLLADDHRLDGDAAQQARLASAGREAVGAEIRIVNDEGADLPRGEVGEILVRSKSVIPGYWRNEEETGRTIKDGWFYTGDLGYLDDERYLFVVDRKKDMVISGGVNIYTKEIESVIYTHADVLETAVIGLPDDKWGEKLAAVVTLKPGKKADADDIIRHCRASLAGFKTPKAIFFRDELPKNPSGKILKRDLRREFEESQNN